MRSRLSRFRPLSSVRGRIIGGFALFVLILAAIVGTSAWQATEHRSNLAELESHSTIASLLQEAEAQAGISALLLQRYVMAGDEIYVPEIQSSATAAVSSLTEAVARGAPESVAPIAVGGLGLTEGAGEVIELRQSGDIDGAAAAMEEIVPIFREFRLGLQEATAQELQEVSDLRSQADRTGAVALGLLIVSGAAGAILGMMAATIIVRSIIKPLSSLEATAAAVSQGDLSARAAVTEPRELAHLGAALNNMMEAVEARTEELHLANQELRERNRQLVDARAQAATDPLTGLGNHRTFHKRIRDEVAAASGDEKGVGLILFDVDGFKKVNDSLGHLAGDEILRELAITTERVVETGNAYRYGGDEFAVVLPETNLDQAAKAAERLRVAVEEMTTNTGQKLTVSLGVGSFPGMAASAEELVYRADMAMYWAKSTGKNRVGDWDGLLARRSNGALPQYAAGRDGENQDSVVALVAALAAKDPQTRAHTERCSWYAAKLAEELGLDEDDSAVCRMAALLHDMGKLVMPDEILCKPGPLNEDEWHVMRQHPVTGMHMLSGIPSVGDATPAILHHHEHFDGSGYPEGLCGEEIPIASRILSVTDAFDAMTSDRPYRKALPIEAAVQELKQHSGTQFDPAVVDAFLKIVERDGTHPQHSASGEEDRVGRAG